MAGRGGRKRGRPPKTASGTERKKFDYQSLKKPKYLSNVSSSLASTPSGSRAESPQDSLSSRTKARRSSSLRGRGRGRRAAGQTRKGYESEYQRYGSDISSDKSDTEDYMLLSPPSEEEEEEEESPEEDPVESETDFSVGSFTQMGRPPRPPSPDPVWLQDREYDDLELPDASDDLLLERQYVLDAAGVYEVLRRFRHLVRLSPFLFEDFCAALVCEEQSSLFAEIHMMLLKAILRFEDVQGTHFGPIDQKDSINISLFLIDAITWPEVLRIYVESDESFDREVYNILCTTEYPYTNVANRMKVLKFLSDQFMTANCVRDLFLIEGPILYDDHCRFCHKGGNLLCCETCPATYHLDCVSPPILEVPNGDWQCSLCKAQKLEGVSDCLPQQEKNGCMVRHDYMGMDRHGRKFWFIARRIFVEDLKGNTVSYYSSVLKLQMLIDCLDKTDLEAGLYAQLQEHHDEIVRQMRITENLTNDMKMHKKSWIEREMEICTVDMDETDVDNNNKKDKPIIVESGKILTRNKLNQMNSGTLYFKLGMDNSFKSYVNQYASNPVAYNKTNRNEERDKRRHLSHKFSLTPASEFKWIGITMGTMEQITCTLRQTLLSFEQNVSISYFISIWPALKRIWNIGVTQARTPSDFSVLLQLLLASMKSVLFANVYHDHLGHLQLMRITSVEREDRKKQEKRDKREREDEEERLRIYPCFVKYSLGLNHQVAKQKGEEYRVHGQSGWAWRSAFRNVTHNKPPANMRTWGQVIVPARVQVHYTQGEEVNEVITVHPKTKQWMQQIEESVAAGNEYRYTDTYKELKMLSTPSEQELQTFMQQQENCTVQIDVSKALSTPSRLFYPKVAKRSRLDNMLSIRMQLQQSEESWQPNVQEVNENAASATKTTNEEIDLKNLGRRQTYLEKRLLYLVEQSQKSNAGGASTSNANVSSLNQNTVNNDLVNSLARQIQSVRVQFSHLNRFAKSSHCYTKKCNTSSNAVSQISHNKCYSPLCLQKGRCKKELLLLLRRAHVAGQGSKETVAAILGAVKRPSILEQKLTEGKLLEQEVDAELLFKQLEEAPIDLLADLEQARASAIAYEDNLWQQCCIITPNEDKEDIESKEINDKTETIPGDGGETFMDDNLDVCGTVEIESCNTVTNTVEDDITAQLTAAANAAESSSNDCFSTLGKRTRRAKSRRTKSFSFRDETTQNNYDNAQNLTNNALVEVKPRKSNRRFGLNSRQVRRDREQTLEKETFPDGRERVYTRTCTRARIYLYPDLDKWREHVARKKADSAAADKLMIEKRSKYPLISHFLTQKHKRSPLILPRHELIKLARMGGKLHVNGYHHLAKKDHSVWPYPCARPLFKTCLLFRTSNALSLAAIALQLRIAWCCMRWDDMSVKATTHEGRHTISTDTEVVTTEFLKTRHMGRYGEKTQYLRKRTTVPLEMPRTIRGEFEA